MGFDIKFLGIVTAAASLGEFFGSRLTAKIVKTLKNSYKKSAEDIIAFFRKRRISRYFSYSFRDCDLDVMRWANPKYIRMYFYLCSD